jgi:hypothetical protein
VEISPVRSELHGLAETGLFEAICAFTPDLWREISTRHATRNEALRAYVTSGTKNVLRPTAEDIGRWAAISREAGLITCQAAGYRWSDESSADDILLALPHLERGPTEIEGVDALLQRYLEAVQAADAARDELLLGVLCEYGRRYELIVETEVPIMEPFTLKVSEDRPLDLSARWTRQSFAISEARSAHLEARFRDPNVTFSQFEVLDANGVPFGIGRLESARRTIETLSLYTSDPDRPLYAEVRLKLRLARHLYATGGFLCLLNIAAAATAAGMSGGGPLLDRLAILSVPTTIAAAFALTREQTALASRLMKWPRTALLVTTAVLWLVVLIRIWGFHPASDPT